MPTLPWWALSRLLLLVVAVAVMTERHRSPHDILSGWDVARQQPKPALRAVPAGSVYWLDDFQGDAAALDALATDGLLLDDRSRRAEGFNNCLLAAWR